MTEAAEANPKLAARTARQIELDVIAAGWPVGVVLGSEAELRQRYGVSRSAFREAVRIVEHHRVATMRRGPSGGLVVRAPDATPSARALVIYLAQVGTTIPDLMYARLLLEPLGAAMAAQSLTDEGLKRLRTTLANEHAHPETEAHDLFHVTLGGLSGNPVIALFIEILILLSRHYADARWMTETGRMPGRSESHHAHQKIVEATIAGHVALAEQRMSKHLRAFGAWLEENAPIGGETAVSAASAVNGADHLKLAEVVADRIRLDLAAQNLSAGEFVCSENELVARYGTSKAVLREAVRLLEYHSVAVMRRGHRGGLFVGRPDPAASAEAIALYLEYKGIDFEALRVVRDAVELGCIDRVVSRRHDSGVAQRLRMALRVDPATPTESMEDLAHAFHSELAELTGNPVLVVFQQILNGLSQKHMSMVPSTGPQWSQADLGAEVSRTHGRIAEAILEGDTEVARYRMRRHLQALSTQWWH
ncbi:MAG TPA: FCD domain-containing protein [Pseudonocardia sp.]